MDGSSFNIVVPEGMGPGSILQVQPPTAATSEAAVNPDASVCPTPKSSFRADTRKKQSEGLLICMFVEVWHVGPTWLMVEIVSGLYIYSKGY